MTGVLTRCRALRLAVLMAVAGCHPEEPRLTFEMPGSSHGSEAPQSLALPGGDSASAAAHDTLRAIQPGLLRTVSAVPVVGWAGPGGEPFEVQIRTSDPASANARPFGTITLRNAARERSPNIGQYPCTSCHLGRRTVIRDQRNPNAHQNIKPEHPRQTGGACATCHAAENVELLALKSGERATLDHSYRVCAQCHFRQAEAWAGGAHGKRLDGWQGRRVVMGCADCHDPHRPSLPQRVPFRAPVLERPPLRVP